MKNILLYLILFICGILIYYILNNFETLPIKLEVVTENPDRRSKHEKRPPISKRDISNMFPKRPETELPPFEQRLFNRYYGLGPYLRGDRDALDKMDRVEFIIVNIDDNIYDQLREMGWDEKSISKFINKLLNSISHFVKRHYRSPTKLTKIAFTIVRAVIDSRRPNNNFNEIQPLVEKYLNEVLKNLLPYISNYIRGSIMLDRRWRQIEEQLTYYGFHHEIISQIRRYLDKLREIYGQSNCRVSGGGGGGGGSGSGDSGTLEPEPELHEDDHTGGGGASNPTMTPIGGGAAAGTGELGLPPIGVAPLPGTGGGGPAAAGTGDSRPGRRIVRMPRTVAPTDATITHFRTTIYEPESLLPEYDTADS